MPRRRVEGIPPNGESGVTDVDRPFVVENEAGRAPVVVVVDHASNAFPEPWGDLGLDAAAREAHIAWDPGALPTARELARLIDAPLIAATVSRLVLDLNRPTGSSTLIPETSETTPIPGNRGLAPAARAARIAAVYEPYHAGVEALIARQAARAAQPLAIVAVHTFTPIYKGVRRHLDVGILFDADSRLALPMLHHLRGEPGLTAEANQPYSPADEVYWTLDRHAVTNGHLNVMIEIRNDLVRTPAEQAAWGRRLADGLSRAMGATSDGPAARLKR